MKLDDFKGYIFDLDGTLLDSFGVWNTVDELFLNKRGFEVPCDYAREIASLGFDAAADYTINRFGLKEKKEDIIKEWNEIAVELFAKETMLFDGAKEYLFKLKRNGKKLSIATASHDELLKPCLKNNGVYELFDEIVTVSESKSKEFPDIYLKCAEKMGLDASECVVFEDVCVAVLAAKAGGFKTVAHLSYGNARDHDELIKISDKAVKGYYEL